MKKWWLATPLVVALLLLAVPGDAWAGHHHRHHGRGHGPRVFVGFGVGPVWGYPYWYYPPPPYYVYAPPPTVIVQQPPVYVQQQPAYAEPQPQVPPPGSAPAAPQQYWYYCQPSGAYYPHVQTCAEPWIKVPPRAQ